MAQPRVLQQAAASGGSVDSEAESMEWTPPSGFCLDPYNDLNTALHGLQPDQTAFGISPDPFVFCAHSGQFSTMAHFPGLGARDRRESDRHYPRDGVAQLGQDIGTNESGPTFGASASQANTFDFENLLVSPITNRSSGLQETINPAMLSQTHWPGSATDSTSSSFGDRSSFSEFEAHSSSSSFGEQSTNSSFKSDIQKSVSSQAPTSNKRRRCELAGNEPVAFSEASAQIVYSNATNLELDQSAVSLFERWLADCPSIYPGDQDFANLAFLTKASVQAVRSWFGKRLRERRMDDSMFEVWLSNYPTVYPGEEEFETLAALTRLNLDTVRMWFVQKLRCEIANAPTPTRPSLGRASEPPTESLIRTSLASANDLLRQDILHNAALWVRNERGTKCTASSDPSVLLRDDRKPFQCTRKCGKKFKDRDDWRKHEELNYPQEGWICDLPATVVVAGIAICTSCGRPDPDPDHFAMHKKPLCQAKAFNARGRLHHRKQHFLQHFDNVHPHIPCEDYLMGSHFSVDSNFPRRCGFCPYRFLHWRDRVDHIGFHFHDEGRDMSNWNDADDEEDHEGRDERHHDRDDEDKDHDDASDPSDDDDPDDRPPRPALKRSSKSKSSVARAKSGKREMKSANRLLQSRYSMFSETCDIQVLSPSGNQNSFKSDSQIRTDSPSETSEDDRWSLIGALPYLHWSKHLTSLKIYPYTRVRVLGCGPYSVVDEVRNLATGAIFARKTINYPRQRAATSLNTEVEIMKKLNHPHIVQFIETYTLDQSFSILMIPSADSDLSVFMSKHRGQDHVPMDAVIQWFSCLVSSLQYLHAQSIKHQDIKPSNILIKGQTIFLADFGIAKTFVDSEPTTSTSGDMTKKYCSPETAKSGMRGRKADIFSMGCVFLEMFSFLIHKGEPNFKEFQDAHSIGEGAYHENLPMVKKWVDILRKQHFITEQPTLQRLLDACEVMLEESTENRPTAVELSANLPPGHCCLLPGSGKSTLMRNVIDNAKVALVALRSKTHLDLPIQLENLAHTAKLLRRANIRQTTSSDKIHKPFDLETSCTSGRGKSIFPKQLTWGDTCNVIINRMIGSGVFSCISVMATLIGTIILSLGVARPLSLATSRNCGSWSGALHSSSVTSLRTPDVLAMDTGYMDSYCYSKDHLIVNLSHTGDHHSWEQSLAGTVVNNLHGCQMFHEADFVWAWDVQLNDPDESDDELAQILGQGKGQKDSEILEHSPVSQNVSPRFTNSSASSAASPGEYMPDLQSTTFDEDDFSGLIQRIPHVSWFSWSWSRIMIGTILPGMIFMSTIPRKKGDRKRIFHFRDLLVLLHLIPDPLAWIANCLASVAQMILGGISEAVLDYRIVSCLKNKSQCSFSTGKTNNDLANISTAYDEWSLHELHHRISGQQRLLMVLSGLVGSTLFCLSNTTISMAGALGILIAYAFAGVVVVSTIVSIAEMVNITALWRLRNPFTSRLGQGNPGNTPRKRLHPPSYIPSHFADWRCYLSILPMCISSAFFYIFLLAFVNLGSSSGLIFAITRVRYVLTSLSLQLMISLKWKTLSRDFGRPGAFTAPKLHDKHSDYIDDSSPRYRVRHVTYFVLGIVFLWIGWVGFNVVSMFVTNTRTVTVHVDLLYALLTQPYESLSIWQDIWSFVESITIPLSSLIGLLQFALIPVAIIEAFCLFVTEYLYSSREFPTRTATLHSRWGKSRPYPYTQYSTPFATLSRFSDPTKRVVILSILFLPNVAIAALFKMSVPSDIFPMYWAVTIPLTTIILLVWILWPKAPQKRNIIFTCSPKGRGDQVCKDEVHCCNNGPRLLQREYPIYLMRANVKQ